VIPRAVLFDLDGTLVATRRLYLESFADALEPVLGRRPGHEEMMALHPRAEVRFLMELGGREAHGAVMERFYRSYRARHDTDFQGVYHGVPEMLSRFRSAGTLLGLVTGKSRESWRVTRPRAALGAFAVAVFDDDVPAPKPDPAGILQAITALGKAAPGGSLTPDQALYVGDSPTDLEAAAKAGVRPGAVLWSKREHERRHFRQQAEAVGGLAFPTPEHLVRAVLFGGW
jgi:pyrophosphatase PpaX